MGDDRTGPHGAVPGPGTDDLTRPEPTEWVGVRPGAYHDSVTLMRISRTLADRDDITDALTAMATELNRDLLARQGFAVPSGAGPNDLVIALRGHGPEAVTAARAALDDLLTRRGDGTPGGAEPGSLAAPRPARTTGTAAKRTDASLALISVPGPHAFTEAADALEAGLNVMVFSDNVPIDQEIALKDEAARRGLLVMGPDCGTALVGGAGLGFANAVRPGRVGLVAASGTGSQQVMCLLDEAGAGVSHALGVGGRDLSAEVRARSTLQALAALDADPGTELILLVSKPPAPEVAALVREAAGGLSTPVLFGLLGEGETDLTTLVEKAVGTLGLPPPDWPCWRPPGGHLSRPGSLAGLFSGGTLCDEAMIIAAERLGPIRSNIPLRPDWALEPDGSGSGGPASVDASLARGHHVMIDFGDDGLTHGRAHPMIDGTLRLERLAAAAAHPACGVVLLDVVLGYGADPDPAATLAPALARAVGDAERHGRDLTVVVSLCGTSADPQGRDGQAAALRDAGAAVFSSNAAAARHAAGLIEGRPGD